MKHFLRYGTNADQKYFYSNGFDSLYDAVVLNANIIAFSPAALASFVVKKTVDKPFFIDPITHAFQHNQSFISDKTGRKIKKSISKLVKIYGSELQGKISSEGESEGELLTKKKLSPDDIDDAFVASFTANVIQFQKEVSKVKKVAEYEDYIEFANAENPAAAFEAKLDPSFLVAPYFYLDDMRWLEKNIQLIEKAKELETSKEVYAEIVISKKTIEKAVAGDSTELDTIISAYQGCSADGFLVWVDSYVEHEELASSLAKYIDFLKQIKNQSQKKVFSLYGSYFSIMLTHADLNILDGVCHGLEYGESRAVVPVGGGIPTAKYYFYPLHKRLKESEMFSFLSRHEGMSFCKDVCDCDVCKAVMDSPDFIQKFNENFGNTETAVVKAGAGFVTRFYPGAKAKENSVRHYLHMKNKEFLAVQGNSLADVLKQLTDDADNYQSDFDPSDYEHLYEWRSAIGA